MNIQDVINHAYKSLATSDTELNKKYASICLDMFTESIDFIRGAFKKTNDELEMKVLARIITAYEVENGK